MLAFIYGTDHYRIGQKLKELKDGFIQKRDKSGLNIVNLDGEKLDPDHFRQEVMTVPFLGDKKMIVVKNIFLQQHKSLGAFADFLKSAEKELDNVLVFIDCFDPEEAKYRGGKVELKNSLFTHLKQQPFCWEMNLLKIHEIEKWLNNYVKKKEIEIDQSAIKQLTVLAGNDLSNLTSELSKLRAYKNGTKITTEDVLLLVHAQYEDNIFNLVDAIAGQNKARALELFKKQLIFGSHPLMILTMISRQFKILIRIKTGADSARAIGVHPFVFQKAKTQANNFSLEQLIDISNQLLKLESQLKFGFKNEELLFDLFIMKNS